MNGTTEPQVPQYSALVLKIVYLFFSLMWTEWILITLLNVNQHGSYQSVDQIDITLHTHSENTWCLLAILIFYSVKTL